MCGQVLRRSSTLDGEPLNKASLLVIVLIDLVLLANIVSGMAAIAQWPLTPQQAFPCESEWSLHRDGTAGAGGSAAAEVRAFDQDVAILRRALPRRAPDAPGRSAPEPGFRRSALLAGEDHLGRVSPLCLEFAGHQDSIAAQAGLRKLQRELDAIETEITALEQSSATIRSQYGTSLLEQIAKQPPSRAIQAVPASQARQRLEANEARIAKLRARAVQLKQRLRAAPESQAFLAFLNRATAFDTMEAGYRQALFWAPSQQLLLQGLFVTPLVLVSLLIHRLALRRGQSLLALISWHLLVIGLVPLLLKLIEFAQVGVLFSVLLAAVRALVGNLEFLVSYVYILLIPLLGFALIKLLQSLVFNPRVQAAARAQRGRCLRCARRLPPGCRHCPHCGYGQLRDCMHCHQPTQRHLPYCSQCGSPQLDLAPPILGRRP
jgi:hypothetical protein